MEVKFPESNSERQSDSSLLSLSVLFEHAEVLTILSYNLETITRRFRSYQPTSVLHKKVASKKERERFKILH